MSNNFVFYQSLLELSEERGKSLNAIEKELSYPRNALHNYKNGVTPSGDRLLELSRYFNVEPEYLLYKSHKVNDKPDYKVIEMLFYDLKPQQKIYIIKKGIEWLSKTIK